MITEWLKNHGINAVIDNELIGRDEKTRPSKPVLAMKKILVLSDFVCIEGLDNYDPGKRCFWTKVNSKDIKLSGNIQSYLGEGDEYTLVFSQWREEHVITDIANHSKRVLFNLNRICAGQEYQAQHLEAGRWENDVLILPNAGLEDMTAVLSSEYKIAQKINYARSSA